MSVVKRIGPFSALKVGFVLWALWGLFVGLVCTMIATAGIPFGPHAQLPLKGVFGFLPLILCPLFYGIIGSIVTALGALLYNFASGWVGGLEVDVH